MTTVTAAQVRGLRLRRHQLHTRAPAHRLIDVVRDIGGVHAQLASSAEIALAVRLEGISRETIRESLHERRTLVKTWMPRGTLHLVATDDVPIFSAVLRQRWDDPGGAWLRGHGVERRQLQAIIAAVADTLDGSPVTRDELADRVAERAGIDARTRILSGWGEYLKPSAHRGELCFGPPRGRSVTFVRPDRWLPSWTEVEPDDARRRVTQRYLRAYGPATPDAFARWLGTTPAQPKRLFAALDDELAEVTAGGERAVMLAGDLSELESDPVRTIRLLPAFDPYIVGFRPRSLLVAGRDEARIFRPQGWFSPVVMVDGAAVGTWKHELRRTKLAIRIEAFGRLKAATRRGVRAEADRLGEFLSATPTLEL